jgi:hypothetical protein
MAGWVRGGGTRSRCRELRVKKIPAKELQGVVTEAWVEIAPDMTDGTPVIHKVADAILTAR